MDYKLLLGLVLIINGSMLYLYCLKINRSEILVTFKAFSSTIIAGLLVGLGLVLIF